MICNKCKKEISDSSKFCKYCGNETINCEFNSHSENSSKINKYKTTGFVGVAIFAIILIIIFLCANGSAIFTTLFDNPFSTFFFTFLFGILVVAIAVSATSIIFNCPNCGEEIKLFQSKLEEINETTSTCKCPKCNKDLIFNTKENTVTVNTTTDNKEEHTTNSTSKLEELYNLKTKGIITEEEFENKKKEFLDRM